MSSFAVGVLESVVAAILFGGLVWFSRNYVRRAFLRVKAVMGANKAAIRELRATVREQQAEIAQLQVDVDRLQELLRAVPGVLGAPTDPLKTGFLDLVEQTRASQMFVASPQVARLKQVIDTGLPARIETQQARMPRPPDQ